MQPLGLALVTARPKTPPTSQVRFRLVPRCTGAPPAHAKHNIFLFFYALSSYRYASILGSKEKATLLFNLFLFDGLLLPGL